MFRFHRLILIFLVVSFSNPANAEGEYWEYTFRPGDSIWKIADQYTNSVKNWVEIQRINSIRQGPDRQIRPGVRIIIPVSMLKLQPSPAIVIALDGNVSLIRADGKSDVPKVGTQLFSGDRVLTQAGQSLRMQFADKSELQVLANSEVILDKLSHHQQTGMVDTRVRLNSGSVDTRVEKQSPDSHYEITTPAAITAVRGTAFRLSADANNISRTEVSEGVVAVSAGTNEKGVQQGYGIVAEKGKPLPEPVKLLPPPELSDNAIADKSKLQVSWPVLTGASFYRYQIATDANFDKIFLDKTTQSTTIAFNTLFVGSYFLRVRGVDQIRLEGIDATRRYEIKSPPPVVVDDSYWKIIMLTGLLILIL